MSQLSPSETFRNLANGPIGLISSYITKWFASKIDFQPLGQFFMEVQTGKTPPRKTLKYYSSKDIGWVKPSDIGADMYITASDWVSNIAVEEKKATIYKANTVLFNCIGDLGRLGVAKETISSNQQITGVLFNEDIIPEYVYYYFLPRRDEFYLNSSKTTLPIINQKGLRSLQFISPKISIQREIVKFLNYCVECLNNSETPVIKGFNLNEGILNFAILSFKSYYATEKLIDEISYQSTLLDQLEQAILQEAVQGKLVPQNPDDEPASVLLERIKAEKEEEIRESGRRKPKAIPPIKEDEIPFEIPESWVWCRLGDVIEYTDNLDIQKYLPADTIIHYVDIDAIDNVNYVIREPKIKTVSELSSRARRVLKKGYILYSTVRPYLKNIAIIDDEKENFIGSTGFNVFKTYQCDLKYIFYFLLSPYLNRAFEDLMVGFNSPSITNVQFENCVIPLPPLAEQQRIVEEVERQLERVKRLKELVKQNQEETEKLLKALLQEAFSSGDE